MTGPFVRVQEAKLFGPTWINVARIVKIQASSTGTTIFLEGVGTTQIAETAEALVARLEAALIEPVAVPQPTGRVSNGARRARTKPAEENGG